MAEENPNANVTAETTPNKPDTTNNTTPSSTGDAATTNQATSSTQTAAATGPTKQTQPKLPMLSDVDESFTTGRFFQEDIANIDDNMGYYTNMSNGQKLKITAMFVPKYMEYEQLIKTENVIFLKYNENIESISLDDSIGNFGMGANVVIFNDGGMYDMILQRYNCFYFVLTFTIVGDEGQSIKLEPYVFDVENVIQLPTKTDKERKLRINLVDLMTSIAKQHSIASVIKCYPNIVKETSYKQVFADILGYMKKYMKTNFLFKSDYKKTARFMNESTDFSSLVSASFRRIPRSASIFEAMNYLMRDAATAIKTPSELEKDFATIGDVSLPFFFRDEYPDNDAIYMRLWDNFNPNEKLDKNASRQAKENYNISNFQLVDTQYSGASVYIQRDIMFRDMYMPFGLAFNDKQKAVFEIFNPQVDSYGNLTGDDLNYGVLLSYTKAQITDLVETPMDLDLVSKKWKNYIIMCSGAKNNNSVLIYFSWMYYWYVQIMLNGLSNNIVSNITPDFFMRQKSTFVNKAAYDAYQEANAIVVQAVTEDPVCEALREIGKNIASFILLNEEYKFSVEGNILRRPNEIIKLNKNNIDWESNSSQQFTTDLAGNNSVLLYVTSVQHIFQGASYTNTIHANKIYENVRHN